MDNSNTSVLATALLGLLAQAVASGAVAETHVSGKPDAVRIDVRGAPMTEVLNTLGTSFRFRYRSPIVLTESLTGTYEGPLDHVIAGMLTESGYDYILKNSGSKVEVAIYGSNRSAVAKSAPDGQAPNGAPQDTGPASTASRGTISAQAHSASTVAIWPPPPPPNQPVVTALLENVARSQVRNDAGGVSISSAGPGAAATPAANAPVVAPPSTGDVAELTRSAADAVAALRASLSTLPH